MDFSGRYSILGPVFLHNMFPFERYFAVLKKYVRNRAPPEGSIAKGYITEKVIEFCVNYVEELCPIGIPVSHHEGRLIGKGTLGRKSVNATDHDTLSKAQLIVLQQSALVAPYMEEHMQIHEQLAWLARGSGKFNPDVPRI